MKKMISISAVYALAGMVCGVFYREFTKAMGFEGVTTLAYTHLHLFVLGMFLFLILALFAERLPLLREGKLKAFLIIYNIALPLMATMLITRGILQVLGTPLSKGLDASISGISGLAHILLTVALVLLFITLIKLSKKKGNGK